MADGEDEDEAQKTEEPTPKKLEEARKKGQVALSREVNNWLMLFMATILIAMLANTTMGKLSEVMAFYIAEAHEIPFGQGGVAFAMSEGFKHVIAIMALPLALLMLAAFIGPFAQIGPLFSLESLKPSMSKISIVKGFGRLFSKKSLMEFLKGILKLVLISIIGITIIYPYFDKFEHLIGLPMPIVLDELQGLTVRLMIGVLITLVIIAGIDLIFQRMEHAKKMRMTKQELKDEYKQTEGDPHIKAKLRQLRSERARQRMMQAVPEADVVITNPTHYAIALKYNPDEMEAPMCLAKGINDIALKIREVAKENDIITYENKPLARALYDAVEVDESIPYEHFKAVAEIISFVFKQQGKMR